MRKIYLSVFMMLLVILSMSISVFAWFALDDNKANAGDLVATLPEISEGEDGEGDLDDIEVFLGDQKDYLTYLSIEDFNNPATRLEGFAITLKVTLENPNEKAIDLNVKLRTLRLQGYGELAGVIEGLQYIISDKETFALAKNDVESYPGNSFYSKIESYKHQNEIHLDGHVNANTPSTKDVYIYLWGNYDNLPSEYQKQHFTLITYRVILTTGLRRYYD